MNWRRAEFVLTVFGFLSFVTLLIRVKQLWGGLPAHPLFVHVPVILIPVTVLAALVCVAKPAVLDRYGTLICGVAIVGMSSTFLAMQAGGALSNALHLQGEAAHLISEHSAAAKVLAVCFTLLTASLILMFGSHRTTAGMPTGLTLVDGILGSDATLRLLRIVVLLLALVAAFYVFRVGDLGARAVWDGRLQASPSIPALGR